MSRFGRILAAVMASVGTIGLALGIDAAPDAWPIAVHALLLFLGGRALVRSALA